MPAKTPSRSFEKFVRMIKAQSAKSWAGSAQWTSTPVIAAVVGLLVSAMLFAIYQSGAQADVVSAATVQKKADTEAARAELIRPDAAAAPATAKNTAKEAAASTRVTLTGCLERDDDSYRL